MNLVITIVLYGRPAYAASAWQTGSPEHINHLSIVWARKASHHITLRRTKLLATCFQDCSYQISKGRWEVQGNNTSTQLSLFCPIKLAFSTSWSFSVSKINDPRMRGATNKKNYFCKYQDKNLQFDPSRLGCMELDRNSREKRITGST